jgi:hypothetical protein
LNDRLTQAMRSKSKKLFIGQFLGHCYIYCLDGNVKACRFVKTGAGYGKFARRKRSGKQRCHQRQAL